MPALRVQIPQVSVEKASLAEEGKAEEFPFFAKAEELLQQALNEKADKSELIAKLEETKKALGETMSNQSTELQQQLDGKASELSEKIVREDSVIFQALNARIGILDKEIKRVEKMMYGVRSRV